MSDVIFLHADLVQRNFTLAVRGGKLLVTPGEKLTETDCAAIRACRDELVALVSGAAAKKVAEEVPDGYLEANDLYDYIRSCGYELKLSADYKTLWVSGGEIHPDTADAIRRHKERLIEIVYLDRLHFAEEGGPIVSVPVSPTVEVDDHASDLR